MAFTRVQANNTTGTGAAVTISTTGNVTSGNLIVVLFSAFNAGDIVTSVTSPRVTGGLTRAGIGATNNPGGERAYIYYGIADSSGACTVTINQSVSSGHSMRIAEFSESGGSIAFDVANTGGAGGTTPSIQLTGVDAAALVLGMFVHTGGQTWSGYTTGVASGTNWNETDVYDLDAGAGGTVTIAGNASDDWNGVAVAFAPGGGGGGPTQPPRSMHQFRLRWAA